MAAIERILVVDDDRDIAGLLELKLSTLGYKVAVHHRTLGALERAREYGPQLILLDVMLADGLGFQVARELRKEPALYQSQILFQSVVSDVREISHAYAEGGDGYLTKPYTMDALSQALQRMESELENCHKLCPVTGLRSLTFLRRHINHKLYREEPLALFYIFMDGLTAYQVNRAHSAIKKIAFATGRAIGDAMKANDGEDAVAAHLGSGYFMVATHLEARHGFSKLLNERFADQHKQLAGSGIDAEAAPEATRHEHLPRKLLIARTHTERHHFEHANEMIEAVRKVENVSRRHHKALQKEGGHSAWVD